MNFKIPGFRLVGMLLLAMVASPSWAQHSFCGTVVTPQQVAKELANLDTSQYNKMLFLPNRCFGKTLSITAHIVQDSLGLNSSSSGAIAASLATLNIFFAPICISFELCNVNYIPNYKYHRFLSTTEQDEVMNLYAVPNTINIFYTGTIELGIGNFVSGYAALPGGPDIIVIQGGAEPVIVHEMGHFFGLYHTFETSFGLELVNGSNCTTAGDLVCDTPADPGLGNTGPPDCQLSPYVKDSNNEWYVPLIGNIMSYYSPLCKCGLFTTQQYNRMASQYQNLRFYLW